ncbi:MAG: hypothetical protein HPY74_19400 [Firmicutes bacterium]|nr:hypothetical protein [Bacillota bacterium]
MIFITFAYLDPGTGSYIMQLIAASILTVGAGVVAFWKKIRARFSNEGKADGE